MFEPMENDYAAKKQIEKAKSVIDTFAEDMYVRGYEKGLREGKRATIERLTDNLDYLKKRRNDGQKYKIIHTIAQGQDGNEGVRYEIIDGFKSYEEAEDRVDTMPQDGWHSYEIVADVPSIKE